MSSTSRQHDPRDWTGEPDTVAAVALFVTLAIGVIGFLVIGAMTLH